MNDYIKRADLAASISDLLVSSWAARRMSDVALGIREALCLVQDIVNDEVQNDALKLPAADVVEVVRCKDCDLWNEWDCAGHKETGNFVCSCAYFSNEDGYIVYTEPDDYCSKGERKEGEDGQLQDQD